MVAPHPPAAPDTSLDHARFDPAQRARALQEALPYILEFAGKTLVIKCGGQVMTTPTLAASFARDVVLVHSVGARPVIVHGGGPQINEHLAKLGKHSKFRNGLRVTDAETLEVARMVLVGKVGREIISLINANGGSALGISGEDGAMVTATALSEELGYVGEITAVDSAFVNKLFDIGMIPVVSSIATGSGGQAYNINADTMASALASSLNAAKLVCLTDVAGIFADPPARDPLLSGHHRARGGIHDRRRTDQRRDDPQSTGLRRSGQRRCRHRSHHRRESPPRCAVGVVHRCRHRNHDYRPSRR